MMLARQVGARLQAQYGRPVDVLVGGVNMRQLDTQNAARQHLGPGAIGIPVDHSFTVPHLGLRLGNQATDLVWAMADQMLGGHLTHTDEKLWQRLNAVGNIGTLEIYSHGAITTGNLDLDPL